MNKKKLAKLISKKTAQLLREPMPTHLSVSTKSFNEYMFSECSVEVKEKSRNMIFRLISLRDQLSIGINDQSITIGSEYGLKNSKSSPYSNDYFSIEIIKDTGYIMCYKDKRLAYRDPKIYDDLIDEIQTAFSKLNDNNFNELYDEVMINSGLARDSNLDELLD